MTAAVDNGMPPRWAERLAGWRVPDDRREFVLGDLDEEFRHRADREGRDRAVRWYRRQAWRSLLGRHPQPLLPLGTPTPPSRSPWTMTHLISDLRYALRGLRHQPAFALAAILTLALGVGANAAIFRVAWQVVLKPLPYPEPDRLVRVWEGYLRGGTLRTNVVAPGNYNDWKDDTHSFTSFAAYIAMRASLDLTEAGEPMQLETRYVTGDYFKAFGLPPLVGRTIVDSDITAGAPAPVVLSEHLWRAHFGGDPKIVGHSIVLNGAAHEVIGVAPEVFGLAGDTTTDVWCGLGFDATGRANHGGHFLGIVARLAPGVTLDSAIADVQRAADHTRQNFPDSNKETSATVTTIESERGGKLRDAMALLAGAAGFVLLIACANLASLQLARGLARAREFGIRTALGASRGRLLTQLLVESLVIAVLGAGAGLVLSSWILGALATSAPATLRLGLASSVDGATVAAAAVLALVSILLFAAAPAWQASSRALRSINQRVASTDRRTAFTRTVLVTSQLALAVMLLVSATLLITSLAKVLRVDPGFDPSGVLTFDLTAPFQFEPRQRLFTDVFRETAALPGVTATCAISAVPFDESFNMTYVPDGQTKPVGAFPRTISPGCIDVLRLRLVAGRRFTDHESARVAIVTQGFAKSAWPGQNPVGQRVHLGVVGGALIDIVGVVADSLGVSLDSRPYPQFYEVMSEQAAFPMRNVLVRTSVPPASLFNAIRSAVRRVDPAQPVARLRVLEDLVDASTAERRFDLGLFAGFAAVALVLSAIGIYGLFAHMVAQRRSEIGIRMALGAAPGSVVRLILRRAWLAVAIGLTVGLAGAYATSGLLRLYVFGLSPTSPSIYAAVAVTLAAVAIVAAWLPSRRAAAIDPVSALRES